MSIRTSNRAIALAYTRAMIEEGQDSRKLNHVASKQSMVASKTREEMRKIANEHKVLARFVESLKKFGDAAMKAFKTVGAIVGGGNAGGETPPEAPAPETSATGEATQQTAKATAKDVATDTTKTDEKTSAKSNVEKAEDEENKRWDPARQYVADNFVDDKPEEVKKKARDKGEEKFFEALNGIAADSGRDAQKQNKSANDAKANAKRASGLARGHKLDAQRLVDLYTRAPADV